MDKKKNIAVMFGGKSPEHEVSIITGLQVIKNIDTNKFNVLPIYVSKSGKWYYSEYFSEPEPFRNLESIPYISHEVTTNLDPESKSITAVRRVLFGGRLKLDVDIFFPCFHGGAGENGSFQGLYEILEVPYVGTEVLGSAAGMDKVICKNVLLANNILNAPFLYFHRNSLTKNLDVVLGELEKKFKYPMFVKPAIGGSSVGVSKVNTRNELKNGLELAAVFDSKVIVEEGIENAREINISVMGNVGEELKVSNAEEVFHRGSFLTYDDKYKGETGKSKGMASASRDIPAHLSPEQINLIKETSKNVFNALNCCGLIRVDFLIKESPLQIFVIEINTIPGSLGFYLWESDGISFTNVITELIALAEKRFESKKATTNTFSSNILKDFKPGIKTPKF